MAPHTNRSHAAAWLLVLAAGTSLSAQNLQLTATSEGVPTGHPRAVTKTLQLYVTNPATNQAELVIRGGTPGARFGYILGTRRIQTDVAGARLRVSPDVVQLLGKLDSKGEARLPVALNKAGIGTHVQAAQIDAKDQLILSEVLRIDTRAATATSTDFSRATAHELMTLAHEVYEWKAPFGNGALEPGQRLKGGFRLLERIKTPIPDPTFAKNIHWPDTQLMLVRNAQGDLGIVFRGTDPNRAKDWATDLAYPQDLSGVHLGFSLAYGSVAMELQGMIRRLVEPGSKVFITGHSLGGALACVCALREASFIQGLGIAKKDLVVYGFGGPRSLSPAAAVQLGQNVPHHFMVANKDDLVTHMPPGRSLGYTYVHVPRMEVLYPRKVKIAVAGSAYTAQLAPTPLTHPQDTYLDRIENYLGTRPGVKLSVSNKGFMRLHWSWQGQSKFGLDQVQLREVSNPTGTPEARALASGISPSTVPVAKAPNLHATYVHVYGAETHVLASWGPYTWGKPDLSFNRTFLNLVEVRWKMTDPGAHDRIALFAKDPRAGSPVPLGMVAATRASRSWATAMPWRTGLWAAYLERSTLTGSTRLRGVIGPTR